MRPRASATVAVVGVHETDLQHAFLVAVPKALPDVRLFRRQVMLARRGERVLRAGIRGQADLYGYIRGGRGIEIELKGAKTSVSPAQLAWERFCREWEVLYLRLRAGSGELPGVTVARWVSELRELVCTYMVPIPG